MAISSLQGLSNLFLQSSPTSFTSMKNSLNFGTNNLRSYEDASNVFIILTVFEKPGNQLQIEYDLVITPNDGTLGADDNIVQIEQNGITVDSHDFGNNLFAGSYIYISSYPYTNGATIQVTASGRNAFGTDTATQTFTYGFGEIPGAV